MTRRDLQGAFVRWQMGEGDRTRPGSVRHWVTAHLNSTRRSRGDALPGYSGAAGPRSIGNQMSSEARRPVDCSMLCNNAESSCARDTPLRRRVARSTHPDRASTGRLSIRQSGPLRTKAMCLRPGRAAPASAGTPDAPVWRCVSREGGGDDQEPADLPGVFSSSHP